MHNICRLIPLSGHLQGMFGSRFRILKTWLWKEERRLFFKFYLWCFSRMYKNLNFKWNEYTICVGFSGESTCTTLFPKLCFFTLNWTSHCCEGHSQRQSSPFTCPPCIVALFSWRGGCCQDDRASSGSVKLSPKTKPQSDTQCCSFEHATSEAALQNWWKPCAGEKQGEAQTETKYRQIAREDHSDILGNNLEPVNFGSQALKKKKNGSKGSVAVQN